MPVTPELKAQILRYYHVEQWRTGTIARQLKVHHGTVERALRQAGLARIGAMRPSNIDPYLPFILETLRKFPDLRASRLYAMVKQRGYQGGPDHFRHLISYHRPRSIPEAYLRLVTLVGEQGQIDWGHFGYLQVGKAKRPLMAFVAVLSWSRRIFLRFSLDARMESFLRGHVQAFQAWGGLPRVLLYDNLKSAVLERQGDAIRFSPTLLAFAAHYHFEPRPVAVARGNEKGRVERAIRYIRNNFFAARTFSDLDDLNAQADAWVNGPTDERPCPQDKTLTVGQAFAQEKSHLLALPANPYPVEERLVVTVGKTPYVRFDLNDYSVPHTQVRKALTVLADTRAVRILDGQAVLASHARSYDKGQQIEIESHIADLVEGKAQAHAQRGMGRLSQAVPASVELLAQAATRGENLGTITSALLRLVDRYGASEVQTAVLSALARKVPHPNAVRLALEAQREARQAPAPVAVQLSEKARLRDTVIHAQPLASYDQLSSTPAAAQDSVPDDEVATPLTTITPPPAKKNPDNPIHPIATQSKKGVNVMSPKNDSLRQRASDLHLHGVLAHWSELVDADWLPQLIDWEEQARTQRSLERRLSGAHIGRFKAIADFDWSWPKQCDRGAIEALMTLDFIKQGANVVLRGNNGVGKSMLAKNMAHQALVQGYTVRFTTAGEMLGELAAMDGDAGLRRRLRHYVNPDLLVIDEIGYLSYSNRQADLLFELVNRRYECKSMIVTTNMAFADWHTVFPNAACVVSLIDRLVHHSEVIAIEGQSYRFKEAQEQAKLLALKRKRAK